jgi:ribosomal protein S18 acetylase RimI-like enzyme
MIGKILIRDFIADDYDQVINLWSDLDLGGAHRCDNLEIILHSIELGGKLFVALQSNKIIATSWVTFDGRRLHLHHFGVKSDFQKKGVGSMLTKETLRFAKQKGYQIKLEVHKNNVAAINLYKKHGFAYLGDYDVYIVRDLSFIDAL